MKKVLLPILLGIILGGFGFFVVQKGFNPAVADNLRLDDQEATVRAIKSASPSVVNISVYDIETKPVIDFSSTETLPQKTEVLKGSGTGFSISSDGLILTNKHVVNAGSDNAIFRITTNNGNKYYAQLIGKDPINDLAVLKIYDKKLPFLSLGDSSKAAVGTTVIAIGNALGKYQNTATKGIISGIERTIEASDLSGRYENLSNIIQTDAQINHGNSGGPLLDLNGKVIGINVAIDTEGGSIGFAIPIDDAKPVIKSVIEKGRIIRPKLGLRYLMLDADLSKTNKLARDSGAWVTDGADGSPAIVPGSAAEKAGLMKGDIIFEINGIKIENNNNLASVTQRYKPGDKIRLKLLRDKNVITKDAILEEFK